MLNDEQRHAVIVGSFWTPYFLTTVIGIISTGFMISKNIPISYVVILLMVIFRTFYTGISSSYIAEGWVLLSSSSSSSSLSSSSSSSS